MIEAKRCTPRDYQIYTKAHLVRREEITQQIALQAWMNQSVKATRKSGNNYKSIYREFKDFYNSQEQFERIFKPVKKEKKMSLADKNRILNKRREEGTNG